MSKLSDYFDNQFRLENFDRVFDRCVRELGMQSGSWAPSGDQKELICDYISERYQKVYEADWWPMVCPVVERDVVDSSGKYVPWVIYPTGSNDPYEPMDAIRNVTRVNPRTVEKAPAPIPYALSNRGIELPQSIEETAVFIEFRLRPPRVTKTAYAGGTTYRVDDVVYDATSGQCYRSLRGSNTGNALSDETWWEEQFLPALFTRYINKGVAADWARRHGDSQAFADRESGRAQAELERISDVARPQQRQIERARAEV